MMIIFKNWEKYNPKSSKTNSWFRLNSNLPTKPVWDELTHEQFRVFIYLLCQCNENETSGRTVLSTVHVTRRCAVTEKDVHRTIEILKKFQIIETRTPSGLFCDAEESRPTIRYDTKRYDTLRENSESEIDPKSETEKESENTLGADAPPRSNSLHKIAEIWNQHKNPVMPEVKSCSGSRLKNCRVRWKENPDEFFWIGIVQRVAKSDFCCGRVSQKEVSRNAWVANFDWLVRSGVVNRVLEGMYDNRDSSQERVHPLLR